jgi:hypothetical protein
MRKIILALPLFLAACYDTQPAPQPSPTATATHTSNADDCPRADGNPCN